MERAFLSPQQKNYANQLCAIIIIKYLMNKKRENFSSSPAKSYERDGAKSVAQQY
jgi:hypothetical protein